jgi:epoxyqueuosine reductase QueG
MLGFVGDAGWKSFTASTEASDGQPNPLDRWSRRIIDGIASSLGGTALYPFGGPPFLPFQRWAQRAEPVFVSPLGILIHPEYGLWHSYRGAVALSEKLELPPPSAQSSPCTTCAAKPCLTTCPVSAFSTTGYDVKACRAHISSEAGAACMSGGCLARLACPVGVEYRYAAQQAAFHMRAFRRG